MPRGEKMSEYAPPPQDPLAMSAKQLGDAKSKASREGARLIETFEEIRKKITALQDAGISVTSVSFDDPVIQSAWYSFTLGKNWPDQIPLMQHEDDLVTRWTGR
jgi:hypothetical protein